MIGSSASVPAGSPSSATMQQQLAGEQYALLDMKGIIQDPDR